MTSSTLSHQPNPNKRWWQKRTVTLIIAALGLIAVLIVINLSIIKNEQHLASGQPVLLELAPVDPRGFMQGDYMALRYALENEIITKSKQNLDNNESGDGYVIVKIGAHNVGQFVRLADSQPTTLAANEMAIYYRARKGRIKLATNAYFFQEGHASFFEAAEYGLFRVNDKGEPLLTAMVDENFAVIVGVNNDSEEGLESLNNIGRQGSAM